MLLFVVLNKLVSQGCSLLYISHKLHEIRALCSACTVLRGGKLTGVCDPREETNASLSRLMIGAEPPALAPTPRTPGDVVLSVKGLQLDKQDPFGVDLQGIDLQVRSGEVVGLAGVSGNGQRELVEALVGQRPRAAGKVHVIGQPYAARRAENRVLQLRALPEEPLRNACVGELSVAQNMALRDFDEARLRTLENVRDGDATLIVVAHHLRTVRGGLVGGTARTAGYANREEKPLLVVDIERDGRHDSRDVGRIRSWWRNVVNMRNGEILNIAGPRESKAPGIYAATMALLREVWP